MKQFIKVNPLNMMIAFFLFCFWAGAVLADNSPVKIGVLAKRGPERCLEKWSLTADYLSRMIPGKSFKIIPLDFDQVHSMVEKSEVDFILANPLFYVDLEKKYRVSRIATLKNKVLGGVYTMYSSVIFYKKQRKDIRHLTDLKGKTVMAVAKVSFGGWVMAFRELKEAGIDPYKDFAALDFGGTHDSVIYAVQEGKADAGIVRTNALERLDAEGRIHLTDFSVMHYHGGGKIYLPFLHSTREYPEWPIAKLFHTSNELAEKVAEALIDMPGDSPGAKASRSGGWTIPLNYQPVQDCLKELRLGPYKDFGKIKVTAVVKKYWIWIFLNFGILVILAWLLALRITLNRKIMAGHKRLEKEMDERKRMEDILRENQEKYRLLVDNASDGIFIDQDGGIRFLNPRVEKITGYSAEELSIMPFADIIHPDDRQMVVDRHKRRLKGESPESMYTFKIIPKSGSIRTVQVNSIITQWENRPATLNFLRDITRLKEWESRLQQSRKMESTGTLAGGIAHDFNNILYPIMGFAEMSIEELPQDHPVRENLEDILAGAKRARDLVKQILMFSTQTESEQKPLRLLPLIKETLKLLRASIPANIEIVQDFKDIPDTIWGEITEIHEIIMNLCTNAYHAMADTGGTLTIGFKKAEPGPELNLLPGEYCCVSISDTGMGIPHKIMNRIFDPYFTTKEQGKGTGLGLSVVHGIVKNHKGAIKVDSEPGRGSVFRVFFPLFLEKMEPEKEHKTRQTPMGDEAILFVDDEAAIVKLGVRVLERSGYKVTGKTSSLEALEIFKSNPDGFDLVITDMAMPVMEGTRLAEKLKEIRPDIPIIICTGFSEKVDRESAASMGIEGYIHKPILLDELTSKVREILDIQKEDKDEKNSDHRR